MNETIKQKRSKAMDMRFYWIVDRVLQRMFKVYWAPRSINLTDYFSKKHTASHHKTVRPTYTCIKDKSPSTSTYTTGGFSSYTRVLDSYCGQSQQAIQIAKDKAN